MASNGNFCTWNSLTGIKDDGSSGITFTNGNTSASMTHNGISCLGTHGIKSGKWYYEINYHADGNYSDGRLHAGWTSDLKGIKYAFFQQAGGSPDREGFGVHLWWYRNNYQGGKISYQSSTDYTGNTGASNSNLKATQANDIIMCAIDADNHKMYWGLNGNWGSTNTNGATATNSDITQVDGWSIESTWQGSTWIPAIWFGGASSGTTAIINAGQDSSFSGTKTSGSANASDSNSVGDFYYTPPTNFLALSSANLPISDDIDPAQTDTDFPQKQFNAITYTGNGSTINVTGLGFQPDLVWIKMRSAHTYNNMLFDSNRGVYKSINSDRTNLEYNLTNALSSFDSDGFTYGNELSGNDSGDSFVAWCWRAGGGVTSSNTDGSITTTLQVGKGFSIGTYTGTGSNATVGHGLGAVPDFTLFKRRDASGNWVATSQKNMSSNDHNLYLQLDNAQSDGNYFQNTAMTSSVISIGTHADINGSSNTYVMYNWINIQGYQRFGKYTGNGNANGPFIYTGFRPRMIFVKLLDSAGDWWIQDTGRSTFNPASKYLAWNRTDTEATGIDVDFLSNGFKIRSSSGDFNSNGAEILYGAWGDVPFKYNNTF